MVNVYVRHVSHVYTAPETSNQSRTHYRTTWDCFFVCLSETGTLLLDRGFRDEGDDVALLPASFFLGVEYSLFNLERRGAAASDSSDILLVSRVS